ncbi:MAG: putative alcohol dehydrogenase AdhA [Chlamydiales bacterium]|nr:putative alcohol dehydrogenase AdhA [Chlamydiales bacterium]MCH9635898.1 putative alcohol dehydrogenase AdhA [Chlamydiales bacterium]MCH9703879.1 zinc-dependent alcohol dehydrogenase family protein [Chlamydiota bacterium]
MKAQIFESPNKPLYIKNIETPEPGDGQLVIKVMVCGICRTDLHIFRGELREPKLPLVLGHQIVGRVERRGSKVSTFSVGDRVGVPWLAGSCQECDYCLSGRENLCRRARFTGYTVDGGFAEYCVADASYCFALPKSYSDEMAAPLLCPGLIGYRALGMCEGAKKIGFFGFGISARILIQLADEVFAFTRPGDVQGQEEAKRMGAVWAGDSTELPPCELDAAIVFASVGELVPQALRSLKPGGVVVTAGIHMSDIPSFPYSELWEERQIRSVANLTRKDGEEFLKLAKSNPIEIETSLYPLEKANEALLDFEAGRCKGAAILRCNDE